MSTSPPTPISSDEGGPADSGRRFRRTLAATIGTLLVACVVLGGASVLQGPRMQSAALDVDAAVDSTSSLRVVLNQAVAEVHADQVTVTPTAEVDVRTDGDVLLIAFDRPLAFATRYRVEIDGVRGLGGGTASTVRHEFTTPDFAPAWIRHGPDGDSVVQGRIGETPTVLASAPVIDDFIPLTDAVVLATRDASGLSVLEIVSTAGSERETLTLPEPGRVGPMEYAGTSLVFTYSSVDPGAPGALNLALFRIDLGGGHVLEPVTGLGGEQLRADQLMPLPGTDDVLVHTRDGELLRWSTANADPPTLIGSYLGITAAAADGRRLSLVDRGGAVQLDLADGVETRLTTSPLDGETARGVDDIRLLADGRQLERMAFAAADLRSFDFVLALDDGRAATEVYRPVDPAGILGWSVTGNESYLVVEVTPSGQPSRFDGFFRGTPPDDVVTLIISPATGDVIATLQGHSARW